MSVTLTIATRGYLSSGSAISLAIASEGLIDGVQEQEEGGLSVAPFIIRDRCWQSLRRDIVRRQAIARRN